MKKVYLLLTLLLSLFAGNRAMAIEQPTGQMKLGDAVNTIETGKWYFMFTPKQNKFVKESNNALKQTAISPDNKSVDGNEGYLVAFEDAGEGKYYIVTANGNYFRKPGSSARGTAAEKTADDVFTLIAIEGAEGHFGLQGTDATYKYLSAPDNGDLKGGTIPPASGKSTDWQFYAASFKSADELTGKDLFDYIVGKDRLIRIHNKRTATAYLTSNTAGSAVGASKAATGLTQVWIMEKSGVGYTLRSAHTGQYLQDDFAKPATASSQKYILFSPNNTGTESYVNISNSQQPGESERVCMNLGNNGTDITKWSYKNDSGSDWVIEIATDVTEDEVRANLNDVNGYIGELKDGAYYRLQSVKYDLYATESENDVRSTPKDDANFAQYWKLTQNGNGWVFQNVLTQNYIQPGTGTSKIFRTASLTAALYPKRTNDKWLYQWTIANTNGGTAGMHTDSGKSVVQWSTDADASIWAFHEVQLTDEQIEVARGSRKVFDELVANINTIKENLANLFADDACTTLKDEIQALSDDQLAANADFAALNNDLKALVLKIKNNTWQQFTNASTGYSAGYEKFFRIADYKVYSNYTEMCNDNNFKMSNSFGRLSGPTGIYANAGDIVYIFVDKDPEYECSLRLEMVGTDGVAGNHSTGTQSALQKGLNLFCPSQQVILYIFHQLNNTQKYLADYPDIKVHIEGGQLNGYWDATRGMTNADWALLQQDLLKAPFVNLKTKHLVFQMDTKLVTAAEPKEMEGLMKIWDKIVENEDRYMGVEDFEGRYNNIWNAFSGASSYMHASTYGTWYTESTISTIMNYANMRKPGNIWGPSHEIGHNHQASINVIGTTESSNNLFSNINRYEQGIQTARAQLPCDNFAALAEGTPWVGRGIWNTTNMFYQLYLYFHVQGHDPNFYPNLFRMMRKKPINKKSGPGGSGPTSYGKDDYLHLAKMICDVAQADLSEFFEAYGMFVPVDMFEVGDYATYFVTTTQADIDAAKKHMQKYEKKLGNIMFIDDHVKTKKADGNNPFLGIPQGTYKVNDTGQHTELGNNLPVGDSGDYEDYDGHTEYTTDNDYCTISSGKISFKGTGYVGHKFYDQNGNLVWATNAKEIAIPSAISSKVQSGEITIVAAEANFKDVPCPFYKSGTSPVYGTDIYFGNEKDKKKWWFGTQTDITEYLPANAIGVVASKGATENVTNTPNIISKESTAKSIVLDGNLPAYIPSEVAAEQVKFTKNVEGYAALNLPFAVSNVELPGLKVASVNNGNLNITDVEKAEAGQPVVVNGNVDLTLANVTLKSGSYQEQENINVLASDGNSVVAAEKASPFIFNMANATAIERIENGKLTIDNDGIYDLSGRRMHRVTKPGLYIQGNRKVVLRK